MSVPPFKCTVQNEGGGGSAWGGGEKMGGERGGGAGAGEEKGGGRRRRRGRGRSETEGKKGLEMRTEERGNRGKRTRGESGGGGARGEGGLQAVISDEVVIRIIDRVVKLKWAARVVNRG